MPAIFEFAHTVHEGEIDGLGHVNNVAYVAWMQSAALAHSAEQGWPPEAYARLGAGFVVRSHRIDYRRPAFLGERIVVRTWVASMKKVSSVRRYHILRAGDETRLATAETDWAFIDYASGAPVRIPQEVACAFALVDQ